jgi:hypothetical protein
MALTGTATALTGIEKQLLEDEVAKRRKPRMFSSLNTDPLLTTPYTLEFCRWLHHNYDTLLNEINNGGLRGKLTIESNNG